MQRAVLMVRRTVVAQDGRRLASDPRTEFESDARFSNPGIARDDHHLAPAPLCKGPAVKQDLYLLIPPDQRQGARAQRMEAARNSAGPHHLPGLDRLRKA